MIQPYRSIRFKIVLFLIFALTSAGVNQVQGQTCGINPGIVLVEDQSIGVQASHYEADISSLLPGWNVYQYQWFLNNDTSSTYDTLSTPLKFGYNYVCLKVYATNPSTGDSCIGEHCNVFFSTGNAVFCYADVMINGLTVDFAIYYYNSEVPYSSEEFFVNYGDGIEEWSPFPYFSHTYATPGNYTFAFGAYTYSIFYGDAGSTAQQSLDLTGGTNVLIDDLSDAMTCDSITEFVNGSSFPGNNWSHLIENNFGFWTGTNSQKFALKDIPGQDYLMGTNTFDWDFNLFVVQDCGIVPDTAYGHVFNDINVNGIKEPMEAGISGQQISARSTFNYFVPVATTGVERAAYHVETDSIGNYKIPIPNDDIELLVGLNQDQIATIVTSYTTAHDPLVSNYGTYDFGVSYLNVEICGNAYLDDDQDSIYTQSVDRPLKNVLIRCLNSNNGMVFYGYSNAFGAYCVNVTEGNYIITPVYYLLDNASIYPDTVLSNLLSGATINNVNFGFTSPVLTNFDLYMSVGMNPKPGFTHFQGIGVRNTGFLNSQGTVVMHYSPVFSSVVQSTAGGVVNTSNNTITWLTDSLMPGQIQYFSAEFSVPANTTLGTILTSYTDVTPVTGFTDFDLSNNSDTLNLPVVGAFDPNDKMVFADGITPWGSVNPDTRLTYRIRFQNTGTAAATNVYITDTLDINLDMNTITLLNSSHPCSMVIQDRVVIWYFYNINLPDSGTNYALSNGFVEFAISPIAGLAEGTIVSNDANIYFDFNEPVTTSEVVTTFQTSFVGIAEQTNNSSIELYPQPAHDRCDLVLHDFVSGKEMISIVDLSGRVIKEFPVYINSKMFRVPIDLQSVAPGFYLINITSGHTRATERLIKY